MAILAALSSLFLIIACLLCASVAQLYEGRNAVTALQSYQDHHVAGGHHSLAPGAELQLLDTVLLASIDGRFHAVNRTTGRILWSMDQPVLNPAVPIAKLDGLVKTEHQGLRTTFDSPYNPDSDSDPTETYIIEPQTGHIFVNPIDAKRDEPLQRLPFSMAQLVDLSPFRFDDHRTFVGKKRTSLITLDLDSGEVLEILDPEQCSWGEQPATSGSRRSKFLSQEEELLDELDSDPAPRNIVHIGRTDYHVSIYSHGLMIQNLNYSSYGPNNVDKEIQSHWRHTPDNYYHQSASDGNLFIFKTDERKPLRAIIPLRKPIVAVFDTVSLADRSAPLVLLQPTPELRDLYPTQLKQLSDMSKDGETTYVGRVGNSLFALSQRSFPLVIFSQFPTQRTLPYEGETAYEGDWQAVCTTMDCLLGAHKTEDALSSSLSRLIGMAPPAAPRPTPVLAAPPEVAVVELPEEVRASSSSPPVRVGTPRSTPHWPAIDPPPQRTLEDGLKSPLLTGVLGFVVLLLVSAKWVAEQWKKGRGASGGVVVERIIEQVEVISQPPPPPSTFIPEPTLPIPIPVAVETKPLPPVPIEASQPTSDSEKPTAEEGDEDDGETEKEGPKKKGGAKRRKRGKGGGKKVVVPREADGEAPDSSITIMQSPAMVPNPSSLVVSDTILGYGSHGTVVFQGSFQGRAVAVKRLLQDFTTLALREVNILQESDDHPNVIRYYFKENKDNFLYIALELCPASLADVIERPHVFAEIAGGFDPKKALGQVTMGLKHLHSLKIVHRDIKPQNILVSKPTSSGSSTSNGGGYRMLISDFGLCRKLESDQTSFLPTLHSGAGGAAAGTVGWRAPEILRGEVKLDDPSLDTSSGGTPNSSIGGTSSTSGRSSSTATATNVTRLTKSVDVFALGILYYYTLTGGEHPYGERFEREVNIVRDVKNLERLDPLGEEGKEAEDLIVRMLDPDPKKRPDTTACLVHPFFWSPARRLGFLQDASDRFEIMCREPREPQLEALECGWAEVVGPDWHKRLDKVFDENLGKFRKYDGRSVQDLLRALRNKKHHYQDLPDNVKRSLGVLPEGFLAYFTRRFPRLFLHVYSVVGDDPLLRRDAMFRSYFDLSSD